MNRIKHSAFDLVVCVSTRSSEGLQAMEGLIERDVSERRVKVNKRTRSSADDVAVRIWATWRSDTISETFSMEVAREDGGFHTVVSSVSIRVDKRLDVGHGNEWTWMVGHDAG